MTTLNYRGRLGDLREYLDGVYRRYGVTDQILFGDRRPVHRPAVEHAEVCAVRTHVFEEGYFRPDWVTLERDGVNGHSLLPRDPDWFREVSKRLPAPPLPETVVSPFYKRALYDMRYRLAGALNPVLFPHYRTHALLPATLEYAGFAWRLPKVKLWHRSRDADTIAQLLASRRPFYMLPLQLNSDAQIRDHSRFEAMQGVIDYVMASFAAHAPDDAVLLVKNHPLDHGLDRHARTVRVSARRYKLDARVRYLESGNLEQLLQQAQGCITVNSTAGLLALGLGCPTLALSDPIYNLPGLTCQKPLDEFWRDGTYPDAAFFGQFKRVVMHATQVNGGFYNRDAIELAIHNSLPFLTGAVSPLDALLNACPADAIP
jgi:capsular polysaccharide export protein